MRKLVFLVYICLVKAKQADIFIISNDENKDVQEDIAINKQYNPTWEDLDARPLPEWYDKAKIGIFLHWGVYSVPGFGSEWFWTNWNGNKENFVDFMNKSYAPGFTYQEFAPMLTAEFFDPKGWAELFFKAGAKYVVLTSKHHEGFTMFPSKRSFSWNSVDVGPKKDIVGEVATAVREQGLKFGVYHSLYEWYNPIYLEDKKSGFHNQTYVDSKLWPDIKQLVQDYTPSVLWADGDWEAHDKYWKSTELLAWLYNESPVKDDVVVNDRWGIDIPGKHGGFFNYADRYNPGKLLHHKWENAFTMDKTSWGFRRNMNINDILTDEELLYQIVSTVSCGGNALVNVGPTKEGTIAPIFQERLLTLGKWLSINGEAIYGSSPWYSQNDTLNGNVWYTCVKADYQASNIIDKPRPSDNITAIYAFILEWPLDDIVKLADVMDLLLGDTYKVQMLGNEDQALPWKIKSGEVHIQLPDKSSVNSENAWTLKITLIK